MVLLTVVTLAVGCATKAPPTEQPEVVVVEGALGEVSVEESTVTVETPQGPIRYSVGPKTGLTFEGQACTLEQLYELQASGEYFDCTVVRDEEGNVYAFNVYRLPQPASVRGTISDVNITDSTVTVQTADGPKVYEVDPATGLLIGGVACSLELVNALIDEGGPLECTVIYDADSQGNALYIDIANPRDFTQGTGTLTEVNPATSTVTIMTDKGERTFEIDAKTGHFLNNEVCSLEEVEAAAEHGDTDDTLSDCQVIYYLDEDDNLVYIDITHEVIP